MKQEDLGNDKIYFSSGENSILQLMVKVVKGVRPDLNAIPRSRPSTCAGFLNLMQRCWATNPNDRPSFQGEFHFISQCHL